MKLSNGSEIKVDLSKISIMEWRLMWKFDSDENKSDEIMGACVGMTVKEIQKLLFRDYQAIARAIRTEASAPLTDPNSPSASTSD